MTTTMEQIKEHTVAELVRDRINALRDDLKVEIIISEIQNKLPAEEQNFLVNYQGQFKRPFRKDVLGAEITDFTYDSTQFVKVNLSRDGIYDLLPEGVFHQPNREQETMSVEEMTQTYRRHKAEEDAAREFFSPFENDFFRHSLQREDLEKELLLELNGSKPIDFFYTFWELDRETYPEVLISKLFRILPYAYQIVGNLELTVHCLSYLLNESVEITEKGYREQSGSDNEIRLGESRLGLDMISGNVYMDYSLYLEFKIGPLKNSSFREYIHAGRLKKFIELFYEYFLPIETDVKTTILLEAEIERFDLKNEPVLGLTTRI